MPKPIRLTAIAIGLTVLLYNLDLGANDKNSDTVYEVGEFPHQMVKIRNGGEGMRRPNLEVTNEGKKTFENKKSTNKSPAQNRKKDRNSEYNMSPVSISGRFAKPAIPLDFSADLETQIQSRSLAPNVLDKATTESGIK